MVVLEYKKQQFLTEMSGRLLPPSRDNLRRGV